jgi:hypothetical protein
MTLLNQVLAVEDSVKSTAERGLTTAHHAAQKDALFGGISRTYRPKDDDGDKLPPESTKVQQDVENILTLVAASQTPLFDLILTKDTGNTLARATVAIDGVTLLDNVPVVYLLFLEAQLVHLQTFVKKLPVLDPSEDWSRDGASGHWVNEESETVRTKKVPKSFVKYDATQQHPAQVEVFHEDVILGYWATKKFSGKLTQERQNELLQRVDRLTKAIKAARAKANSTEVEQQAVGREFFNYLFGA